MSAPILAAHGNITMSFHPTLSGKKCPLIIAQGKQVANSASCTLGILGYVGPHGPFERLQ